jgi:PGAP1-like protein
MSEPTRNPLPLILIRGYGGLGVEDEKKIAYQGFNDGTVYPHKRGENYIYEGLILRFMKSSWRYQDATNIVGYFPSPVTDKSQIPEELKHLNPDFFSFTPRDETEKAEDFEIDPSFKAVIDPGMALTLVDADRTPDPCRTLWVLRYYDLNDRRFRVYGEILVRLIDFIQGLAGKKGNATLPKVNIIAHSMGGLIVREAVQKTYPKKGRAAGDYINKIVTLGTPHRGISFQILKSWIPPILATEEELEAFSPDFQKDKDRQESYVNFNKYFDPRRLLTVVGTNYKSYSVGVSSFANRLFSVSDEYGPNYNRSDGLVKQISAQIPGSPRTFVHKCHGGFDSLVTARESFEIATRFFFGNIHARLRLVKGKVLRGKDFFGKSEFFFGVSIKPRKVDFDLFHQSTEAENCYGPFSKEDADGNVNFSEKQNELAFPWADDQKLIWEGNLDTSQVIPDPSTSVRDLVLRLDFYVGERDLFGLGFSDNVVFRKQYYVRGLMQKPIALYLHTDERFVSKDFQPAPSDQMKKNDGHWQFNVTGTGFEGTFSIELYEIPEEGQPVPFDPA